MKRFYEQNASKIELVNLYTDIGHVLSYSSSNYETSLKYFFKAIRIAENQHFPREATLLYARIAWVYYLMEQDNLSEEFSNKALNHAGKISIRGSFRFKFIGNAGHAQKSK
ncbi:MAG: hypothetical protein QM734_10925 [Cyclobacteriaceae bacterium]